MRPYWLIFSAAILAGCATQRPVAQRQSPEVSTAQAATPRATAMTEVDTPYAVRGYRDPDDPTVWHEAHTIYRETRVPRALGSTGQLDTLPRSTMPTASYAPLPANAELAAESATQKQITADLRAIQSSMATTQQRAEAQYGKLVNAMAETLQLRQQLEAERAKVRAVEAQPNEPATTQAPAVAANTDPQPKW